MHALRLIARYKADIAEQEAALLIYDAVALNGTMLSDDIRDHFNERPITKKIFILAPFVTKDYLVKILYEGGSFERVRKIFQNFSGEILILGFAEVNGIVTASAIPFVINEAHSPIEGPPVPIPLELRHGWLFSLFDLNKGLLSAPVGVHFGKGSKKHSSKFLRTSSILLNSEACAAIAYFTLANSKLFQPRRIFVDTAPLISVAFALQRIAKIHGLWDMEAPVSSFSSYGGIERLPRASRRDIVLISASTSGNLIKLLVEKGFASEAVLLLFYLGKNNHVSPAFPIVCDLTYRRGLLYGYSEIDNYVASECPLCEQGYFLAALEGDQFMLESRAVKELIVRTGSQPKDARETVEVLARNQLASIPLYPKSFQRFEFNLDFDAAIKSEKIRRRIAQLLRRFSPMPLNYIILVDISAEQFNSLMSATGLIELVSEAKVVQYSELRSKPKDTGAGVLVFSACLNDYAKVRDINAELRSVGEDGCIAYISALTLAESPENFSALKMFLTYGANGRDSFTFASAYSLMLPYSHGERSSWERELELLLKIVDDGNDEEEILERISVLRSSSSLINKLFWPGKSGELSINKDFVYLTTESSAERVTQADIYVVVSNLLASVRLGNRSIIGAVQNDPIRWQQSVYGQTLLSTVNFDDYNDAILRAAFVRAASGSELNYSTHSPSSARMLEILKQGIVGWSLGMGDFLPEFILAIALKKIVLADAEMIELARAIEEEALPSYIKKIASYF